MAVWQSIFHSHILEQTLVQQSSQCADTILQYYVKLVHVPGVIKMSVHMQGNLVLISFRFYIHTAC